MNFDVKRVFLNSNYNVVNVNRPPKLFYSCRGAYFIIQDTQSPSNHSPQTPQKNQTLARQTAPTL